MAVLALAAFALTAVLAPAAWAKPRFSYVFTCHSVTYNFTEFPNAPNNSFREKVKIDGVRNPYAFEGTYTFNGPSGSDTVPIIVLPGHHEITAYAEYKTNGIQGESDYKLEGGITCGAEPGFAIEKLQKIAGSGGGYTATEVTGHIGQTVEYEIVVKNTGNVPMTFNGFTDENCEAGTITGGPGEAAVAPGASTTYFCHRPLPNVGKYYNEATVTGDPPEGDGPPITHSSNPVVANVPAEPAFVIEKQQQIMGSGYTKQQLAGNVGQTVEYEIVLKNTGNVPLSLEFNDPKCDPGTISGGPAGALAPGEMTTYFCDHVITEADKAAGLLVNTATVTGDPPENEGFPVTHESNPVVVEVPPPHPHVKNEISCSAVTFTFSGFPNRPNNTVKEKIKLDGMTHPYLYEGKYVFSGPTGMNTVHFTVPPGQHEITAYVEWNTNGIKGESDYKLQGGITCSLEGAFTVEKRQKLESASSYSTEFLTVNAGERVDYEVIVTNGTNSPMKFSSFTDEGCEPGTVSGGSGEAAVKPGESTTWLCSRVLTEPGVYPNTASVTGTPTLGESGPVTQSSNTVTAEVPSGGI